MDTTLRIGFAMGGGVSLGTFSGAALTQALKLLLLRGVDRNGDPYGRVEVDVLSGASAGSMCLAILLRGLAYPDWSREGAAAARLAEEFRWDGAFERLTPERREHLVAAQIVQDIQEEVWVREMNLDRLLAARPPARGSMDDARRRLRHAAGLLDRRAVEDLARTYMEAPVGGPRAFSGLSHRGAGLTHQTSGLTHQTSELPDPPSLLSPRVLFAMSIANLSPLVADGSREYPTAEAGIPGLSDALTSKVHRELRVFDLHFRPVDAEALVNPHAFPRRWCRYHAGPKIRDRNGSGRGIGSLAEGRGWAKITATAIASGAFPLAFEPVPLERRSFEYGETETAGASSWPPCLRGKDRHVFTYVDGGLFNNEPIREAFRLASFLDARRPSEDFERVVIFVDPHVTPPPADLHLDHHRAWIPAGHHLERASSLDRLLPLAGSLVSAVADESQVVEADKVFRTRKRFQLRNEIRAELEQALDMHPPPGVLESLSRKLDRLLEADRTGVMIPAGALTLEGELARVLGEEGERLASIAGTSPAELAEFARNPASVPALDRGAWLRALAFAAVDRVMDLEGKMEASQLVAISPARDPAGPRRAADLPGRRLGGFGGFMSELPGRYEVELGRYCAQVFLEASGRIPAAPLPSPGDFSGQEEAYARDLRRGLSQLEERLFHLLTESHVPLLGRLSPGVLRILFQGRLSRLARESPDETACELRLRVPDAGFKLGGGALLDPGLSPVRTGEGEVLITLATFSGSLAWRGTHVEPGSQSTVVYRSRPGPLAAQPFCTVALPTPAMLKKALSTPHAAFSIAIHPGDRGTLVEARRWRPWDGVQGLERTVLG